MTRHVIVVVAPLSAFILFHATEGALSQEQPSALAASKLGGQELASQKSSSHATTLVALSDPAATEDKSNSLVPPVSTSSAAPGALSETHAENTVGRAGGVAVRSAMLGDGACIVFDNQAEFEAFNQNQGKLLKGIEDFEESIQAPGNTIPFDDPLCGGVPVLPAGLPFINGLAELSICVQSNFEHTPANPNPRGGDALIVLVNYPPGKVNDVVLPYFPADSLDLILTSPPVTPGQEVDLTGVGFRTISIQGGNSVEMQVFDKNDELLATSSARADPAGSSFWGICCSDPIGRINIFGIGDGREGADNIQLWGFFVPAECGNGSCEPGETCGERDDPAPACFGDCGTCICGDGVVTAPGEDCDPPGSPCPFGQQCSDTCTCGPVNNHCVESLPIVGGDTDFDTHYATTDGVVHKECQFDGTTGHDLWYNYRATCTGDLTVSTCGQATYDTDLVVYDGCQPDDWTCPPGDAEMLGCNDNSRGCPVFTSRLTVPVVEGNCYTMRVGGWREGDMGSGTVTLTCSSVCGDGECVCDETCKNCPSDCGLCGFCGDGKVNQPSEECDGTDSSACPGVCQSDCTCPREPKGVENDFCADAIGIKCGDTDYDTTGASTDGPVHPECQFDGQTYHDIWYEHTAVLSGDLTVSTCNQADYGTDLVVYDGCDCGDLVLLGCNDDFPGCAGFSSEVTVPVVAGNCYFVRLGGWLDGDMGTATVTLSGEACGEPDCGSCTTDVDGSGDTGAADLAVLLGSWGPCAPGEACVCLDANDDGTIGAEDLAVLLGAWGPCP